MRVKDAGSPGAEIDSIHWKGNRNQILFLEHNLHCISLLDLERPLPRSEEEFGTHGSVLGVSVMQLSRKPDRWWIQRSFFMIPACISDVCISEQRLTSSMVYFFRFFYSSRRSSLASHGNTQHFDNASFTIKGRKDGSAMMCNGVMSTCGLDSHDPCPTTWRIE